MECDRVYRLAPGPGVTAGELMTSAVVINNCTGTVTISDCDIIGGSHAAADGWGFTTDKGGTTRTGNGTTGLSIGCCEYD